MKEEIDTLATDLQTAKNKIVALKSQKTRSNVMKRNLVILKMMTKKKYKKKKSNPNNFIHESDKEEIKYMKQKNRVLEQTVKTQTNQIENLYLEINNLQEKKAYQQEKNEEYDKLDKYLKKMSKKNRKVKTVW